MTSQAGAGPRSLGTPVEGGPASRPARTVLEGRLIDVRPFEVDLHAAELFARSHGSAELEALWDYLPVPPFADAAAFARHYGEAVQKADPLLFALVDKASGRPVGHAAYMRIEPGHRTIEVGNILFTPAMQRSVAATEAMYLMARHVFEDLGYRRYEWKCNALNLPSRRAAERLGFTFEGIFRQHMLVKGHNRDTAWFSLLDGEWPKAKAAFEAWLAPENFSQDGTQKRRLEQIRNS